MMLAHFLLGVAEASGDVGDFRRRLLEASEASEVVRSAMHAFGGSTGVARMGDILKIHVHTDTPEAVFTYAARWAWGIFYQVEDGPPGPDDQGEPRKG